MGSLFASCCGGSGSQDDYETVDREKMRQATERRFMENESRGIKNIESVKRQQEAKLELEKMERNAATSGQGLKVNLDSKLFNPRS
ncbi:small VCP p97-interacting [Brachionus plicatilis]|uniref:Small VCP p97-interacting n=1 Tax=Brachionus plicatilis TaxID=10195 RepID=A0A3M7SMV3_BRAPC|nr:small VCP p97-interacting [Brachionus plicatilis]